MSSEQTAYATDEKGESNRRKFLLWSGWAGIVVTVGVAFHSLFRFIRPRVLFEPPAVFRAGRTADYPRASVSEKWKSDQKVWIVHGGEGIYALISICTHLACTPNWFEEEKVFKCPCHGSVFTIEGDVVSGPAPSPLYRAPLQLSEDGELIVGTGLHGIRLSNQSNEEPKRSGKAYLLKT